MTTPGDDTSCAAEPGKPTAPLLPSAGAEDIPPLTQAEIRARRYVIAGLLLVMALASMEMTVTSTAMPTIIGQLHGLERYSWVQSVYLLASTITMPIYGRLADALGRKRMLRAAIVLFILGSVLSGSAQSMTQLIIFRGIQGLGAGGIMPVVLTILADIMTLKERTGMQAVFSAVWGGAALAGPLLGHFLVESRHLAEHITTAGRLWPWLSTLIVEVMGWRAIFYVNLPFGLLGMAVLAWKYHEHQKPRRTDLDLLGAIALAGSCIVLHLLVSGLDPEGWSRGLTAVLTALAGGFIGFFIWHELRTAHAIMPPRVLLRRAIGPALFANALLGVAQMGVDTYVPLYVQGGRGLGSGAAATVVTSVMLTWAIANLAAAPLVMRWGFGKTAAAGSAILIAGFAGMVACAHWASPQWVMTLVLGLAGLGMGPCSMSYLLGAQDAAPSEHRGSVTGSVTFFRTIGGALGVGLLGSIFKTLIHGDLARLKSEGVTPAAALDPNLHFTLSHDVLASLHYAIATSLTLVFTAMLFFAILQGAATMLMPQRKSEHTISKAEAMEALAG